MTFFKHRMSRWFSSSLFLGPQSAESRNGRMLRGCSAARSVYAARMQQLRERLSEWEGHSFICLSQQVYRARRPKKKELNNKLFTRDFWLNLWERAAEAAFSCRFRTHLFHSAAAHPWWRIQWKPCVVHAHPLNAKRLARRSLCAVLGAVSNNIWVSGG